ncbi:MAG: hypothetical protein H6Q68_3184 [Firmicutes bacterium]|nr:hypothetical protein [Bacillota bacterium]
MAIRATLQTLIIQLWARFSLRKKLSIAFVTMTLMPIILITVITWQPQEQIMKNSIIERNRTLAEYIANDINDMFTERIRFLKNVVNNENIKSMAPGQQVSILRDIVTQYPDMQLAVVSDIAGRQIARWDGKEAEHTISYTDREYFNTALKTGETTISGIIMAKSTKKLGIVIAEPIKKDESLVGVLIINIELSKLIQRVGDTKVGNMGYAYIVNREGKVIIHPDLGIIDNGADESSLFHIKAAISGQKGWMEYDYNNEKRIAAYSYVPSTKWGVIAQQPLNEAMGNAINIKIKSILVMVSTVVIAILMALAIAGALARPIADISEATNRLAEGDLAVRLEVSTFDEIGQLATNFNNMTNQLVKRDEALCLAQEELENQVKKRTEELMIVNEELRRISFLDGLTGIANRRYFDEFLEREWQRSKRENTSLALIMLDVDFFKNYNDTYGHIAGDECLRRIADILKTTAKRATDLVVRYGGEEFAIILPDTNVQCAKIVGERVRSGVEKLAIRNKTSPISEVVTVSVGISVSVLAKEALPITIIAAADEALYQSKQNGRNRIKVANVSWDGTF